MRSPFEIAFDHVWEECTADPPCNFEERRLCPEGRAKFQTAHEACKRLAGADIEAPKAKA